MARRTSRFGELLSQSLEDKHRSDGDIERLSFQKFGFWFQAKRLPKRKQKPSRFQRTGSRKTSKVLSPYVTHLSKRDIANWRNEVSLPRKWQYVVMLAALLDLDERAADELLIESRHPLVAELRVHAAAPEDKQLLAHWTPRTPPPFQAISPTKKFVGRVNELKQLERALTAGHTVTITSVRGMGGVGKTTIAAQLAERVRDKFPDGVLWGALERSDTMSILALFAGGFQRDVSSYRDVATRAAAVRDVLKDKRVLLILDNATSSDQVVDLLPSGESHAAVLITTRNELVVSDEAIRFKLQPFDKRGDEAFALFKKFLGKHAGHQREGLDEIARLLGHLPLALAIAGGHIASVKAEKTLAFAVEQFLHRVRDEKKRLGALDREILSVRASLGVSYDALADELKKFFVTLGAFAGTDFDASAAAFVAQVSEKEADAHLNALEKLSLVQETQAGRVALHELVRDFAREKLLGTDAYARMCEYYFRLVEPYNEFHGYREVVTEDSNIHAAMRTAVNMQDARLLTRGVLICAEYFITQGQFNFFDEIADLALKLLADDAKFERMRLYLKRGEVARLRGNPSQARAFFQKGLPIVYELEESKSIAEYLANLGVVTYLDGYFQEAEQYYQQAISVAESSNHTRVLAGLYNGLAHVHQVQGNFDAALEYLGKATENNADAWQIASVTNLITRGRIAAACGEFERAREFFIAALNAGEQTGVNIRRIGSYDGLARIALARDEWDEAEKFFDELVRAGNEIHHQSSIAVAYCGLGETAWRRGDLVQAQPLLQRAIDMVEQTDDRTRLVTVLLAQLRFYLAQEYWEEAREIVKRLEQVKINYAEARAEFFFGKAQIEYAAGNIAHVRQFAQDALTLYEKMKHYRVAQVRTWLTEIESISSTT